ncbi:actinia tenebrosa protease inhibitors-like [Engraulis encrasicolus]|uniref:actinia tenebrosa protease inhibitors-like n=1 Tax=Engraulis encrasicolus TaxID=184585 RepID=UPI002FD5A960
MEFRMRFTLLMLCCSYAAVATAQVTEMPGWATQTSAGKPELCFLPPDEGTSEDGMFMIYLHYDAVKDKCYPFKYYGSGGNANRFESERDCIRNCSANANTLYPSPESKACHLPKASGECFGQYLRYYYDARDARSSSGQAVLATATASWTSCPAIAHAMASKILRSLWRSSWRTWWQRQTPEEPTDDVISPN